MERWFVKREELVLGPYSEEELQGYLARGKVTAADLVSRDGKVGWTTIYQVPQFRDVATRDAATRPAAPPPEPESETPPAASVRAWYVARGSQVAGPLDLDALRATLIQGKLKLDDKVCEVGATEWRVVGDVPEIAKLLPATHSFQLRGEATAPPDLLHTESTPLKSTAPTSKDNTPSTAQTSSAKLHQHRASRAFSASLTLTLCCVVSMLGIRWKLAPHWRPQATPQNMPSSTADSPPHSRQQSVIPHLTHGDEMTTGNSMPPEEVATATHSASDCPNGMIHVPAGEFLMGSPPGQGSRNERPQHRVRLSAFCLDIVPVTVAAYLSCVRSGTCEPAHSVPDYPGITTQIRRIDSRWCNAARPDRGDHPLNCVNWTQAVTFCHWRSARLPTEAEWEYAARGSTGRRYTWGDTPEPSPTLLNACGRECAEELRHAAVSSGTMYSVNDGWPSTAPVGSFPAGASPFGILDMAGNVMEWTGDWYGPYQPSGGTAESDPTGPTTGSTRVVRGSDWARFIPSTTRAAVRRSDTPTARASSAGFRCAFSLSGS